MSNKHLTECVVCSKKISKTATICPNCGESNPSVSIETKKIHNKILILLGSLPLIFAITIGGMALYFLSKIKEVFQIG